MVYLMPPISIERGNVLCDVSRRTPENSCRHYRRGYCQVFDESFFRGVCHMTLQVVLTLFFRGVVYKSIRT